MLSLSIDYVFSLTGLNFDNRFRIEYTLFGKYVDELNAFLASGEVQKVVISIEFAKLKLFQGV